MHLLKHHSIEYKLIAKSKYFNKRWYLKTYSDVAAAKMDPVYHYLNHGWKEGRNPGPNFNTCGYLFAYKSVNESGLCPLVHFEKYGKKQHLKTNGFVLPSRTFPKDAKNVVKKFKISKKPGRTVIFAMYNKDCVIPKTTVYYLTELKKIASNIILIADNPVLKSELEKIKNIVNYCQFIPHDEYDFGSYKRGFIWAKENNLLDTTSDLVFCNDSCYGPVYDFENVFDTMQKRNVDFWGLCANIDFGYHIQSYFWVLSSNVFRSNAFINFISSVTRQSSVQDVIMKYEIKFTKVLQKAGFSCDTYIPYDKNCMTYPFNVHHNPVAFPVWSVKNGCPLVKVKALTKRGCNFEGIKETLEIIKNKNKKLFEILLEEKQDRLSPSFSIILPTYNRKELTVRAIHSILAQTYQNFEIIVVDDGSKDKTKEYLDKHFAEEIKNKKIRYFYKPNEGVCKARNYGLRHAKYNWIAYMDSDNTMMPNFLETFTLNIRTNNNMVFYCKSETMLGGIIGKNFNLKSLIKGNYIDLGIFVHHISVYKDLGGFDENMTRLVDWELIVRYTKKYEPFFIQKVCMLYNDINDRIRISNNNSYISNFNYYKSKHWNVPKITTMITAYNHAKYIAAAIESAVSQTGDFVHEILISDDGSTDKTRKIIKQYVQKYPHIIRDISRDENHGISNNMKYCFKNATGEYIAILEGDDYWTDKHKLQKQMDFLRNKPECTMVFNRINVLNEAKQTFSLLSRHDNLAEVFNGDTVIKEPTLNLIGNFSCCMFRTNIMKKLPPVLFKTRFNEIALSFYLCRLGQMGFIKDTLSVYRQHENGVWTGADKLKQLKSGLDTRQTALAVCDEKYKEKLSEIIQKDYLDKIKELQEKK